MTHEVDHEAGPRDRQRLERPAHRQGLSRTKRAVLPQRWHRRSTPTCAVPAGSKCGSRSKPTQKDHAVHRCAQRGRTLIAHGLATEGAAALAATTLLLAVGNSPRVAPSIPPADGTQGVAASLPRAPSAAVHLAAVAGSADAETRPAPRAEGETHGERTGVWWPNVEAADSHVAACHVWEISRTRSRCRAPKRRSRVWLPFISAVSPASLARGRAGGGRPARRW